ncbi:MAG: hypothetical protein RLZ98_2611 [Pseudomonadota bacterium]
MSKSHVSGLGRGRGGRLTTGAALLLAAVALSLQPAMGEDGWNPFEDREPSQRSKRAPKPAEPPGYGAGPATLPGPGQGGYAAPEQLPPLAPGGASVERVELMPIAPPPQSAPDAAGRAPGEPPQHGQMATPTSPGSGPASAHGASQPVDEQIVATLLGKKMLPNSSPTLTGLWYTALFDRRGAASESDLATRVEALWQSGFPVESGELLKSAAESQSPLIVALRGRTLIGLGNTRDGCRDAQFASEKRDALPKPMVAEVLALAGYCGIVNGKAKAAAAVADLMREQGLGDADDVALLAAAAQGAKLELGGLRRLSPLGYRLVLIAKSTPGPEAARIATAPALALMSLEKSFPAGTAIAVGEAAARANLIPLSRLAGAYRRAGPEVGSAASPAQSPSDRAGLFAGAESEISPLQKTRLVRGFLDNAKRDRLYLQALLMAVPLVDRIRPVPEIGWFAETGVEVLAAAGQYQAARGWTNFRGYQDQQGGPALAHWQALIDLADPAVGAAAARGTELRAVEALALQGRFAPEALHRLATILDALDYNVPMRLWEAASKTAQPNSGHLPETGILKDLQDASRSGDRVRTALLAVRTLGANGGEGAHMIALGDALRALRRAGFNMEAKRIAFEALLAIWPRATN